MSGLYDPSISIKSYQEIEEVYDSMIGIEE